MSSELDGTLLVVTIENGKGNILDIATIDAIRDELRRHPVAADPRTVLFVGAGDHFSYGASIDEHRAEVVADLLAAFHGLLRDLAASGRVLLAAVRGRCLGGGVELAAFCHRVFATPDADVGCPEITLGVFAPAASVILPHRVGQSATDDLLLSGRTMSGRDAARIGLVDEVAAEPVEAARSWHRRHLLSKSATAMHHATRAARVRLDRDLDELLPVLERRYLDELMSTRDAREGIQAFLDRRPPTWSQE